MKRVKRLGTVLCTFFLVLTITTTAWAGNLSVTRYEQEGNNWCWAASAQMIGKYITGTLRSQSLICTYVMGGVSDITADLDQMKTALFYTTSKTVYSSNSCLSLATTKSKIDASRPFMARLKWSSGGHAVVISGYTGSSIRVIDPAKGCGTANFNYTQMTTGVRFQSGYGSWSHSIWVN